MPLWAIAVFAIVFIAAAPAEARKQASDAPAAFEADTVTYDTKAGIITASGAVQVEHDGRTLRAAQVVYNAQTKEMIATGNVEMVAPDGTIVRAAEVQVEETLRDGFVQSLEMFLEDKSRLTAQQGQRQEGSKNTLHRAAFTPCEICPSGAAPLWEIRAKEIIYNEENNRITYKQATLEVFGVPVFFVPYFRHGDHTVTQQTGFLMPTIATSREKGIVTRLPFYWGISGSRDVTITPVLTTRTGELAIVDYREKFSGGELDISFSGGHVDRTSGFERKGKGREAHIDARTSFHLNERWRGGATIARSSSKTYLRRYGIDNRDVLTTQAYAERFTQDSYLQMRSMAFQGLREIDNDRTAPILLPEMQYNVVSAPVYYGGRLALDANSLILERQEGADMRRFSTITSWEKPQYLTGGGLLTGRVQVQADAYQVANQQDIRQANETRDKNAVRLLPTASMIYRHPFVRNGAGQQLIEPVIGVSIAPNGSNSRIIANEDSQIVRFDDANLFLPSRYAGRDRVSSGQRLDYGVNTGWYGLYGVDVEAFVGQSVRLSPNSYYTENSGLEDTLSDYVGRLAFNYTPYLDVEQRFRLNKDTMRVQRNEIALTLETAPLQFDIDYLYLTPEAGGVIGGLQEVSAQASALLSDQWVLSGQVIRDLEQDTVRYAGLGIAYFVKCLSLRLDVARDFPTDRALPQENVVMLRLGFEHLGAPQGDFRRYLRERNRITGRQRALFETVREEW